MIAYKIQHKQTGWFYIPSRTIKTTDDYYVKSNLSKKGKIYHNYPNLAWAQHYYNHFMTFGDSMAGYKSRLIHCSDNPEKHWKVIRIE